MVLAIFCLKVFRADSEFKPPTNTRFAMKNTSRLTLAAGLLAVVAATGCRNSGSPYQPGPVAGTAVGEGVGVVAGNVAGFGAGVVGGTVDGTKKVLDPSYHMVRYWKTETTPDGRTIQVPYDILVDEYGRPAVMPAPTGNPAPPPATTTNAASK
jgi:hypothetical protein